MNREQYLQSLITKQGLSLTITTTRLINQKLTEYFLEGQNNFDVGDVKAIVTDTFFSEESLPILNMVIDYVEMNAKYTPSFSDAYRDFLYWAIDADGKAYYYYEFPNIISDATAWGVYGECVHDVNFNPSQFPKMWMNDAWKTSLVSFNK